MDRQRAERPRCEVYGSAAARRFGLDENVAGAGLALECAIHDQAAIHEVDIAPEQSEGLTEAESGGRQQDPQRMQPMTFAGPKQPPDLFFGERVHLPPSRAWAGHCF